MKTKMIWGNLTVKDIERTTRFYTELGFKPNGTPTKEITSFLFSDTGFAIHFFTEDRFNDPMNGNITNVGYGNEVIFSLSAESKEDVDKWADQVINAGGTIFSRPGVIGKGYNCGFSDPDGHKFNVLYWPG